MEHYKRRLRERLAVIRETVRTARRILGMQHDSTASASVNNAFLAALDPVQVRRIDEQGACIEIKTGRMHEGTYPYIAAFINLDRPAACEAFLDALFNKSAVVSPAQDPPGLYRTGKLFVCGFFNAQDGSFLITNILPKA